MRLRYGPSQHFERQHPQGLNDRGEAKWRKPISNGYVVRATGERSEWPNVVYRRRRTENGVKAPHPINENVDGEAVHGDGGIVGSANNPVTLPRCQTEIDDLPRLRNVGVKGGRADESPRRPRKRRSGDEEGKQ